MDISAVGSSQGNFYMKLLMAQLQNQDPMDPMSNSDMVTQMAQLSLVDEMQKLNTSFSQVLRLQMLAGGAEMIGRQVEYMDDGQLLSGVVESVLTGGDTVILTVGGDEVPLSDVRRILGQ